MDNDDPAVKTPQFPHQRDIYLSHRDDQPGHALFLEMGLGKTKIVLDVASHLFLERRIDALLVVAPKSVYRNWLTQEIPPHLAVPMAGMAYHTKGSRSERASVKSLIMLDPSNWQGRLRVVVISYPSLLTTLGQEFCRKFCTIYRTMMMADESTAIKNPKTETAKIVKSLGAICHYRWIGTGTPVAQSPFDVHSQIEFVSPDHWRNIGMRTREAFKNEFGVFRRERMGRQIFNRCVSYRNLDKLNLAISTVSTRLLKEDSSVKLPPKIYTTRTFRLLPAQRKAYESLRRSFEAELDAGVHVEASLAITRLMRLQQICSGFVSAQETVSSSAEDLGRPELGAGLLATGDDDGAQQILGDALEESHQAFAEARADEQTYEQIYARAQFEIQRASLIAQKALGEDATPEAVAKINEELAAQQQIRITRTIIHDVVDPKENPRLLLLQELLDEALPTHKVIVWCRFTRDVQMVCDMLGDVAMRYDGSVAQVGRERALDRFRDEADPGRVLVVNLYAMSQGVTLTIAKTSIYYTNVPSLEKRLQSEDRSHRIGQDQSVHIIDMAAEGTVDVKLISDLKAKFEIAASVTGDRFRDWILPYERGDDDE